MIELSFKDWAPFKAKYDKRAFKRWLQLVAEESKKAFIGGMRRYPPASKARQYPAIRTGKLRRSIRVKVTNESVEISSNTRYSGYLRTGTGRMKRRKMSDNALKEGISAATKRAEKWVGWSHGSATPF